MTDRPQIPAAQAAYGRAVYWLCVVSSLICALGPMLAVAFPRRNVMDPHFLFYAIWQGKRPLDVWREVGGGFPGGHFWLDRPFTGDGFAQFGLALGCASAGLALLAAAVAFLARRPRSYGWAAASLFAALMIALAAVGIFRAPPA